MKTISSLLAVTALSSLFLTSPAFAQLTKAEALTTVERQLNDWKAAGRYEDIKLISTHNKMLMKQIKDGKIDLQAIVDEHNYNHKDGRYYGQTRSKRQASKAVTSSPLPMSQPPVVTNTSSNVPASNKPVGAYTRLEQSWKGFPATLTYTAHVGFAFPNGNFVNCANWDPAILNPTRSSVGRAVKDCEVSKTRGEGKKAKKFRKGQTINVKFGNVSANGFDWGSSSSSQISGSKLLMTKSGRIAIGKFRGTYVRSGGNGVGSSSRTRPLVGTYHLDGHIITITSNSGEVVNGFVAWTSNSGSSKIDHIYLNGEHFWDRSK